MNGKVEYIRSKIIKELSVVYFKFLKSIDWEDDLYLKGIREGRNKFLSNAYLNLCKGKHSIVNYYSKEAIAVMEQYPGKLPKGKLIFEHMVPKEKYIQAPSENIIRSSLTEEQKLKEISVLIDKYWQLASITIAEDKRIQYKKTMPENWNQDDIFARYKASGIEVVPNPLWDIR